MEMGLYLEQVKAWPGEGRWVMGQFDEGTVVVYQAYRREIAAWAVAHQQLGGPGFSWGRMSWIKPNFLWMMYRSGWGTKAGQEGTLALRVRRDFFEEVLGAAVASSFEGAGGGSREEWAKAVEGSEVRVQWDPDHDPRGAKVARRAVQLGLRGRMLERLGKEALVEVVDLSGFVEEQREFALGDWGKLRVPVERVFRAG